MNKAIMISRVGECYSVSVYNKIMTRFDGKQVFPEKPDEKKEFLGVEDILKFIERFEWQEKA